MKSLEPFTLCKINDCDRKNILLVRTNTCFCYPAADRRKSNCVKEVEKIEQRRKDRRKEQAAIREQQEVEYDTSDPNWQFSAMIKYVLI